MSMDDFDIDEMDFGDDMGGDGFGGFDETKPRSPADAATQGAWNALSSSDNHKDMLKALKRNHLPEGFNSAQDALSDAYDGLESTYEHAEKILAGPAKRMGKTLSKKLDKLPFLPDRIRKSLKGVLETEERSSYSGPSEEERKEEEISGTLNSIFEKTSLLQAGAAETQTNIAIENQNISKEQHSANIGELSAIRKNTTDLLTLQRDITTQYQRKSLELQMRQLYATKELLEISKAGWQDGLQNLINIAQNTSLPDLVKTRGTEVAKQMLLQRTMSTVAEKGADVFRNAGKTFFNNVKSKVSEGADVAAQVLDGLNEASEMTEMMMEGQDPNTFMAEQGTGALMKFFSKRLGVSLIGDKLKENGYVKDLGARAEYLAQAGPLGIMKLAQARMDKMESGDLKDGLQSAMDMFSVSGASGEKLSNSLKDEAITGVEFDNLTRRSIIEVIPGYLSRSLKVLTDLRDGTTDSPLLTYSIEREAFVSMEDEAKRLREKVVSKDTSGDTYNAVRRILERIDPTGQLSTEDKLILAGNIIERSRKGNDLIEIDDYTEENIREYLRGEDSEVRDRISTVVNETSAKSKEHRLYGQDNLAILEQQKRLGAGNRDFQDILNTAEVTGTKDQLLKAGLLTLEEDGSYRINKSGIAEQGLEDIRQLIIDDKLVETKSELEKKEKDLSEQAQAEKNKALADKILKRVKDKKEDSGYLSKGFSWLKGKVKDKTGVDIDKEQQAVMDSINNLYADIKDSETLHETLKTVKDSELYKEAVRVYEDKAEKLKGTEAYKEAMGLVEQVQEMEIYQEGSKALLGEAEAAKREEARQIAKRDRDVVKSADPLESAKRTASGAEPINASKLEPEASEAQKQLVEAIGEQVETKLEEAKTQQEEEYQTLGSRVKGLFGRAKGKKVKRGVSLDDVKKSDSNVERAGMVLSMLAEKAGIADHLDMALEDGFVETLKAEFETNPALQAKLEEAKGFGTNISEEIQKMKEDPKAYAEDLKTKLQDNETLKRIKEDPKAAAGDAVKAVMESEEVKELKAKVEKNEQFQKVMEYKTQAEEALTTAREEAKEQLEATKESVTEGIKDTLEHVGINAETMKGFADGVKGMNMGGMGSDLYTLLEDYKNRTMDFQSLMAGEVSSIKELLISLLNTEGAKLEVNGGGNGKASKTNPYRQVITDIGGVIKAAGGAVVGATKAGFGFGGSMFKFAGSMGAGSFDAIREKLTVTDIYQYGEDSPIMTRKDLVKGYYMDSETKKPLKTLKALQKAKGDIIDVRRPVDSNIVVPKDQLNTLYRKEGGAFKKITNGVMGMLSGALRMDMAITNAFKSVAGFGWRGVKAGYNYFMGEDDLYLPGEESPILLGRLLDGGKAYFVDGEPITKVKQIVDTVTDKDGKVLVALEDIPKLRQRDGSKPGTLMVTKIARKIFNLGVSGVKAGFKMGNKIMGVGKTALNVGVGALNAIPGIDIAMNTGEGSQGVKDSGVLSYLKRRFPMKGKDKIYQLLKERLPRPKGRNFMDGDGDGDRDGSYRDQLSRRMKGKRGDGKETIVKEGKEKKGFNWGMLMGVLGGISGAITAGLGGLMDILGGIASIFGIKSLAGKAIDAVAGKGAKAAGAGMAAKQGTKTAAKAAATQAGKRLAIKQGVKTAAGIGAKALTRGALAFLGPVGWAITGVGLAYEGYKHYQSVKDPEGLDKLRFMLYGMDPTNDTHTTAIRALEDKIEDKTTFSQGQLTTKEPLSYFVEEVGELFGIDLEYQQGVENFKLWFDNRFIPVYSIFYNTMRKYGIDESLSDMNDEVSKEIKPKFTKDVTKISIMKLMGFEVSPFADGSLFNDLHALDELIKMLIGEETKPTKPINNKELKGLVNPGGKKASITTVPDLEVDNGGQGGLKNPFGNNNNNIKGKNDKVLFQNTDTQGMSLDQMSVSLLNQINQTETTNQRIALYGVGQRDQMIETLSNLLAELKTQTGMMGEEYGIDEDDIEKFRVKPVEAQPISTKPPAQLKIPAGVTKRFNN